MDIQEIIDFQYQEIGGLKQKLSEDHYMNPEQEDELEELIAESIKFGELCAQRDAKASVPEGFVLVEKQQLAQLMADMDYMGKKALGSDYVSFADVATLLDEMIEAQEPSND